MHGLATFGVSVRAIIRQYANNDPSLFKAVKVRFTKPVYPGDTLKVEMWQEGNRIYFRTLIADSGVEVLSGEFDSVTRNEILSQRDAVERLSFILSPTQRKLCKTLKIDFLLIKFSRADF